jgi:hypothetical protein
VTSWVVLALIIAVFAGIAVGMYLVPPPEPSDAASALDATTVPVGTQRFDDSVAVNVTFQMGQERPLITQATGTVTSPINSPLTLSSGNVAFQVDARPVVALHTAIPLFRDLVVGDCGQDVKALNDELSRLGRGSLSSDVFSDQTRQAWAGLLWDFGISDWSWGLSVADVLWLPDIEVAVASWSALPGTSVSAGMMVGQVQPGLVGMDISVVTPQEMIDGNRTLTVLGVSVPLDDLSAQLPDDFLQSVEAAPKFAWTVSESGPHSTTGTWALTTPTTVFRVPPSAVFAIAGRDGCVQSGDHGIPVKLVGAGLGATLVIPDVPTTIDEVSIGPGVTLTEC